MDRLDMIFESRLRVEYLATELAGILWLRFLELSKHLSICQTAFFFCSILKRSSENTPSKTSGGYLSGSCLIKAQSKASLASHSEMSSFDLKASSMIISASLSSSYSEPWLNFIQTSFSSSFTVGYTYFIIGASKYLTSSTLMLFLMTFIFS